MSRSLPSTGRGRHQQGPTHEGYWHSGPRQSLDPQTRGRCSTWTPVAGCVVAEDGVHCMQRQEHQSRLLLIMFFTIILIKKIFYKNKLKRKEGRQRIKPRTIYINFGPFFNLNSLDDWFKIFFRPIFCDFYKRSIKKSWCQWFTYISGKKMGSEASLPNTPKN